jgi:hypothetical protein
MVLIAVAKAQTSKRTHVALSIIVVSEFPIKPTLQRSIYLVEFTI